MLPGLTQRKTRISLLLIVAYQKGEVNRWPELHELAMGNDELLSNPGSWFRLQSGEDLSGHQHNPFFVRASSDRYYDIAKKLGLDDAYVTRGIATADVDEDGDLDLAIANQWQTSYFYRNDSPYPGKFLGLRLLRGLDNPAIGATAKIYLPNGRQLVAQVDGGNGHSGARSPNLHFGLGQIEDDTQLSVDLQWRDTEGQVHQESLFLSPGWHTLLLGNSAKPSFSSI